MKHQDCCWWGCSQTPHCPRHHWSFKSVFGSDSDSDSDGESDENQQRLVIDEINTSSEDENDNNMENGEMKQTNGTGTCDKSLDDEETDDVELEIFTPMDDF